MNIELQIENEFIPSSFGNKKKKKEDQIIIIWRHPTASERNQFRKQFVDDDKNVRVKIDYDKIVETCVLSIKNCFLHGEKIDTAIKLNEAKGLSGIVDELTTEILIKMNEINSKNF